MKLVLSRARRAEFAAIGAGCGVLALLVKNWWRPQHVGGADAAFVLGIAPNFLYSFGMPLLLLGVFRDRVRMRDAIGLALAVILFEFAQLRGAGRTFDPWDIGATLVGAALFYAYYRLRTRDVETAAPQAASSG